LDFVSNDELKPALNGIWIKQENETLVSCATDGHYMEFAENLQDIENYKMTCNFEGILPAKVIGIMAKFFRSNVTVYSGDNYIRFELPNKIQVYSRLVDEQYPDIDAILKQPKSNTITLDKKELLKAINSCLPFTNSETKLGVLSVKNGSISITANDVEKAIEFSATVPTLNRKGSEIEIGFNIAFLNKVIKSVAGNEIIWLYEDIVSASLFRSAEPDHKTNLLMPVRLEEN